MIGMSWLTALIAVVLLVLAANRISAVPYNYPSRDCRSGAIVLSHGEAEVVEARNMSALG